MTDQMQTIKDDLAYLRALAEEGRDGGERGGAIGMAAGVIFAACSVVQWAELTGRISGMVSNGAWIVGVVLFFIALVVLKARMGAPAGRSRAFGVAWQGVGWAIFTLFVALAAATWRTQSPLLDHFRALDHPGALRRGLVGRRGDHRQELDAADRVRGVRRGRGLRLVHRRPGAVPALRRPSCCCWPRCRDSS